MFMAEEEIPMSARRNVAVKKKGKENVDLINVFKKFNNKVKEKQDDRNSRQLKPRKSRLRSK